MKRMEGREGGKKGGEDGEEMKKMAQRGDQVGKWVYRTGRVDIPIGNVVRIRQCDEGKGRYIGERTDCTTASHYCKPLL